jgi:hypothetical protein
MAVFWVVAPCSLVEVYQRFRGPCCLHHQGDLTILASISFSRRTAPWSVLVFSFLYETPLQSRYPTPLPEDVTEPACDTSVYRRLSLYALSLSTVLFQYYEEHQYPIHGKILKPITCVEPSPGLSGNVIQMISLVSENSGSSLTSRWRLLFLSRFTRFRYTRRFAGTRPPRITRVASLCIQIIEKG